ncbi:MAG: transposase [Woeseia sp.]
MDPTGHRTDNGLDRAATSDFAESRCSADRDTRNCIFWIVRSGARWIVLPGRFPSYHTCRRRFQHCIVTVADGTRRIFLPQFMGSRT